MAEPDVYQALINARRAGQETVLATIIRDQGSVPRHAGSKMLAFPDGTIIGTIGGGEMESRVIEAAPDILSSGKPSILHYELADPARGDPGVCGGQVDIFMEPILSEPTVLVIGCGHVGQAVVELAHWLGFYVIACDDRADLCNPEAMPDADQYLICAPADVPRQAAIHRRTFITAVTRGVTFDVAMLPGLLDTPAPYIGVIGSRRRWATTIKKLKEEGVEEHDLARIHAPIGLELKAETPAEIAVSIMAEIIARMRGGTGEPMKWMGDPEQAGGTVD